MNFIKKVLFIVLILVLVPALVAGASVLFPYQGGTGIGSVTSGDVGKFLAVSSTNPFAYKLVTVSGGGSTTSTLQDVTTNGNTTTNQIQFAGGTSTAAFTIQGLLTAPTGSFTYTDATTTNATFATIGTLTGSNATITNVSSTNMSVSSSLLVAGKAVCLVDGTNCLATSTPTLQQVATAGNTTSLALIFAGGTSTANFVVTGTFSAQTTTLGTVTAGTWAGSSIATTYTDAKLKTLTGTTNRITVGGTATDPTVDISTSYAGQNTITTLGTVATGVWNGTKISEAYGGTNQSTYTLGDTLYASAANTLSKLPGNTATTRKFYRQTGDGANSAAPAWDTITAADIPGAALTKTDDTNVTLTLGGSPTTALLNATSLTLGWTGQLGLTRGGTGASLTASNGGICYSTGSALAILAGTATANKVLMSGASGAPSWSTPTFPNASATAGKIIRSDGTNWLASTLTMPDTTAVSTILYSSSANTVAALATANSGVLVTSAGGVPSIATDIPTAVTIGAAYIYRAGGTDVPVTDGGLGVSTLAAHGVVIGNGTSAVNVTSAGTANQVLTSNGASADPTFQALPGATFGSSTLASAYVFSLPASVGTYFDTGLSVTLPSAGTYWISYTCRGQLQASVGTDAFINCKMYNSTDSVDVPNSVTFLAYQRVAIVPNAIDTASIAFPITVSGSKTIKLYASLNNGTTFTYGAIDSDTSGYTIMAYHKISN